MHNGLEIGLQETTLFPIENIVVPQDGRILNREYVATPADSNVEAGALHPIMVDTDDCWLAECHRLAGHELLVLADALEKGVDCAPELQELITIDENLLRLNLNAYETVVALARRKVIYEELYPETKHGGRRAAGQKRNGPKSFIADAAEKTGRHKDSIGKLARIGGRLIPLPPTLNDHPIKTSLKQLELLSMQEPDVQQAIVEMLASGEVKTVMKAVTGRNGQNGADSGRDEAEAMPDNCSEAADGPEVQDDAAPSCSAEVDEDPMPASGDLVPEAGFVEVRCIEAHEREAGVSSNGNGGLVLSADGLRECETHYSEINVVLAYLRPLVEKLGGPLEIVEELEQKLLGLYRAQVDRNGRERPSLPPVRRSARDDRRGPKGDAMAS